MKKLTKLQSQVMIMLEAKMSETTIESIIKTFSPYPAKRSLRKKGLIGTGTPPKPGVPILVSPWDYSTIYDNPELDRDRITDQIIEVAQSILEGGQVNTEYTPILSDMLQEIGATQTIINDIINIEPLPTKPKNWNSYGNIDLQERTNYINATDKWRQNHMFALRTITLCTSK